MTATSLSPTSRAGSFLGTAFRFGAPWANACILAAVAAIVLAVSIPEIRAFVVRSNETDARTTLCKLGALVLDGEGFGSLGAALEGDGELGRWMQDARALESGALCFHGYYYALSRKDGVDRVLAWPREAGNTGTVAFAYSTEEGLIGHPNGDDRWSGLERPLMGALASFGLQGWRRVATP
jgi:hypothetical protein